MRGRKVLIIGGSSGLGLAFAKILKKQENDVTITSRSMRKLRSLKEKWGFEIKALDVNDIDEDSRSSDYDYIFCCSGVSYPSYFMDQQFKVFEETINTNYLGTVNVLKHYSMINKRPFGFIMIGSTLSLFTFPGFSSYSPSKSALLSLFYTIRDELNNLNIDLYLYNTASIITPGYKRENKTKPIYTKSIENMSSPSSAEDRAITFLRNMTTRRVVSSDIFTYLCQIRIECECLIDYCLFPVSVVVIFISKIYVRLKFRMASQPQESSKDITMNRI